jgi:hypothetical protein
MITPAFAPTNRSTVAHPRNAAFGLRESNVRAGSSELRLKF